MQMAGGAADGAYGDEAGKHAFVALKDLESSFSPKLAALPTKFGAEAAQPGYGGGLLRQVLEAQAGERGAVGECRRQRQQDQAGQQTDPEKSSPLSETHFTAPPGRRWLRSCPNLCFE